MDAQRRIDTNRLEELLSLAGFWGLLVRRRRLIASSFAILLVLAGLLILLLPDEYQAEMRLMVKRARTNGPVDATLSAGGAGGALNEAEVVSEIELIRSRNSLEETVRRTSLVDEVDEPSLSERERVAIAVRNLEQRLSVVRVGKTNLIEVDYIHKNPSTAANVVRILASLYLAKHMAVHRNKDTSEFFEQQSRLYAKRLRTAQNELAAFRARNQVSLLNAEKQAALRGVTELERSVQQTDSRIQEATDRIARLRDQIASMPETIETSSRSARNQSLVQHLKTKLLELENRKTQLLTKYDPSYRLVKEVEAQLHETNQMLAKEMTADVVDRTRAPNPLRQTVRADLLKTESTLAGLRAGKASYTVELGEARADLLHLEQITARHDDLVRNVKLAEDGYLLYQRKHEESRLEDAMDRQRILNVAIVEDVEVPALPTEKHRAALFLIAAIMAGFGSLTVAFVGDLALPAPASPSGECFEKPPLNASRFAHPAAVEGRTAVYAGSARRQIAASAPAVAIAAPKPALVSEMMPPDLAERDDYGPLIDYFSVNNPGAGVTVGFSPVIPAADVAVAAVQMAYSMHRRNGLPILLLDTAPAGQGLAAHFGLDGAPGLHEMLNGPPGIEKNCIHRTSFGELWILPEGNRHPHHRTVPASLRTLYRALANRSMNLIVHLPRSTATKPDQMLYAVLDAVLAGLGPGNGSEKNATEMVRRVKAAKQSFPEPQPTVVGVPDQWLNGNSGSLRVC